MFSEAADFTRKLVQRKNPVTGFLAMAARKMTFPVTQHTDSGHRSRHGIRP